MLNRAVLIFLIAITTIQVQFGQHIISPSGIKWYSINEALELAEKDPLPIMLDIYTNWNTWCDYMMKTTFASKRISDYVNENFYAARLNAGTIDTIYYKGEKYFNRNIGRRPANDLAIKLLDGNLTFPSIVFFDKDDEKLVVSGYKESKDIEPYLVYFAEDLKGKVAVDDFIINFMFSFPEAFEKDHSIFKIPNKLRPDTLGVINWMKSESLNGKKGKKKKPVLLYLCADWSFSSIIMEKTSLRDRELAEKINDYYHPVKINVSDSIVQFFGKTYHLKNGETLNEIANHFFDEDIRLPALVVFDENQNLVTAITGFLQKEKLLPLTDYFINKVYKKHSLQEYFKNFVSSAIMKEKNKTKN